MSGKDGLETTRDIRSRHPLTKIIVITGGGMYGRADLTDVSLRLGADRAFLKPIDFRELLDAVRALVG